MEVILTHEQADFDALASMLAVSLLVGDARPILPSRVNRNVHNFLNLYGADLPFIELRDLAANQIDLVYLVDTQSLVTLKGINKLTRIHVVDHHAQKSDLPAGWEKRIEMVGATTTILVDLLREQNCDFNIIQASLLLLGIYEDTGSLTYATTTVRDVKAAAFLLEKGANLNIVAEFLNPALSEGQRRLADRLMANAQNLTIHGKQVFISSAEALDLNEEISTIAHKLRDLLDPDALFLLVRTSEGIRLVARSTTDQVNVSKIAHHFGGGGHERAAAALIQVKTGDLEALASLNEALIQELKKGILPPLTVGRIMSRRPHLIGQSTSVAEAARLMQRYGYEGYPVVEDDKVVGLLTRRAVDRAITHKLKLTAGSLMEAGEVTLLSTDTIDQLQQVMTSTGWGQIPVLDPETRKITGIVTRTDLLKTLQSEKSKTGGQKNLAAMLGKALSPSRLGLLKLIAAFPHGEANAIYIVGGFVRDLLLERPSPDFDLVIEGDAISFCRAFAQQYGGRVVSHKRFGTAKWQLQSSDKRLSSALKIEGEIPADLPDSLDFISARTEFYDHPTALPTVERSSIKLDLHRRDFTINTLAMRLDGTHYGDLYDYWDGLADIEKKQVRVLHSLSFVDDPTRLLRAVRFEQRFKFHIEKRTLQLMTEARELLHQLSGERIHHELDLIFSENEPSPIMHRLEELNLLSGIHPKLGWRSTSDEALVNAFKYKEKTGWHIPDSLGNTPARLALAFLVWLSNYDEQVISGLGRRLRLSNQLVECVYQTRKLLAKQDDILDLPPSAFSKMLEGVSIHSIYAAYCLAGDDQFRQKLDNYVLTWRKISPTIDGNHLREMGVPPGPVYARILSRLREAWLDGEVTSKDEEGDLLDALLKSIPQID